VLTTEFLLELKHATETKWHRQSLRPDIYGFQIQPGTRWISGLTYEQIEEYETILRVKFPLDFRRFLQSMNGTDLPTVNIYGSRSKVPEQSVGVYSYPRDLERVRRMMEEIGRDQGAIAVTMTEQGFTLPTNATLVPVYSTRFLVCTSNLDDSTVLSIHSAADAVVYGNSFAQYLEREFLGR
jgi:hypothetical protein